jgi:O-antigen ligase
MPANREHTPAVDRVQVAIAWLATAATAIIPLAVVPDLLDRFRPVKEFLVRSQAILALFLLLTAILLGGSARLREMLRERALAAFLAAGVAWAVLTAALSTHRGHSAESLISFLAAILIFVTTWYAAPKIGLRILDLLVPATLVNTVLSALQEYRIYQPFSVDPDTSHHLTATGLIGNPNIVGTYMTILAITFAAAAARIPSRRWWYSFGVFCAVSGVFVSRTRTAFIALLAGFILLAIAVSVRRALAVAGALVAVLALGFVLQIRVIQRIVRLPARVATAGVEVATSGRLTPALTGLAMFRDHPLTGVGPGAFKYQYFPYQIETRRKYGQLLRGVPPANFGEAHNDHVQLLAEAGLPGYVLFLAGIGALVRLARRPDAEDERGAFIRLVALPLAVCVLVLALAQFPLHVAVTRHLLVTLAGLTAGWSRR